MTTLRSRNQMAFIVFLRGLANNPHSKRLFQLKLPWTTFLIFILYDAPDMFQQQIFGPLYRNFRFSNTCVCLWSGIKVACLLINHWFNGSLFLELNSSVIIFRKGFLYKISLFICNSRNVC